VEEEFSNVIIPDDATVVNVENVKLEDIVVEDLTGEIPIVDDVQNDIQQPERRYPLRQRTPKVRLNLSIVLLTLCTLTCVIGIIILYRVFSIFLDLHYMNESCNLYCNCICHVYLKLFFK
jgi:hypothetical protein